MDLKDFPRPADDNGWGFHSSSGAYEQPWMSQAWREKFVHVTEISHLTLAEKRKIMRDYAQMLHDEYGIRWFKLLAASDSQLHFARALVEAGIETIVRTYTHEPHASFVVDSDLVKRYTDLGVHYIEWGNEPNLYAEWDAHLWDRGHQAKQVAEQLQRNFDKIQRGGGIPMFPALSPGGDIDARQMVQDILAELKKKDALGDLEGAAVAIHNRPHNIPASEPSSDTLTVAFREYEWIDDLFIRFLGHSLPLFGTEAGYEIGDATHPDYPPITGDSHAAYNMEILQGFQNTWRPSLFCVCLWLVELYEKGNYSFANAAWWYNKIVGESYPDSTLPAVQALREAPRFARVMPWEEGAPPSGSEISLTVTWPTDGAQLTTDNIEIRGQVSIPGSTVSLQVNDSSPRTVGAGPEGMYSFSAVHLGSDNNHLELWAVSAAGQESPHQSLTVEVTIPNGNGNNQSPLESRIAALEIQVDDLSHRGQTANDDLSQVRVNLETLSVRMRTIAESLHMVANALPEG